MSVGPNGWLDNWRIGCASATPDKVTASAASQMRFMSDSPNFGEFWGGL
jgi:hypothetical protein